MLKKDITYTNPFTEQEETEEHWFHLTKADMIEMEMEEHGRVYRSKGGQELTGILAKLQKVIDDENGTEILDVIKGLIKRSYGKRDGDRFLKNPQILAEFTSSEAYSQLVYDLCTDGEAAGEFTTAIFPSNLEQEAARIVARAELARKTEGSDVSGVTDPEKDLPKDSAAQPASEAPVETGTITTPETRILTPAELATIDAEDLKTGLASGKYKLS